MNEDAKARYLEFQICQYQVRWQNSICTVLGSNCFIATVCAIVCSNESWPALDWRDPHLVIHVLAFAFFTALVECNDSLHGLPSIG